MSYWNFNKRLYADRRCADGLFSSGWRKVKKGGRIKAAGNWYQNDRLKEIEGELVHVMMNCYWLSEIIVSRGVIGCSEWYCNAKNESQTSP